MSNHEKHDFVPCTCEDCFGRDDACCAYCHSRKSDPIHTPAEAQKPPCRCEQPYEAHANLPLRSRKRDGRKVTCYIYQPAEAQAETTLSQPNLEPGWLSQAISAPERPLEEVVKGAYNPYNSEAQAVKPAPENGEYSILGYDGERQSPTSSAPSAPEGSQVGKPISEEACDESQCLCDEYGADLCSVHRHGTSLSPPNLKQVGQSISEKRLKRMLAAAKDDLHFYTIHCDGDGIADAKAEIAAYTELLALRTENADAKAALERLKQEAEHDERMDLQTIDERDAAEDALSEAYAIVVGEQAEWSNLFGHREALDAISERVESLTTENASLLAAINRSNELDRDAAENIVELRRTIRVLKATLEFYASGVLDGGAAARAALDSARKVQNG